MKLEMNVFIYFVLSKISHTIGLLKTPYVKCIVVFLNHIPATVVLLSLGSLCRGLACMCYKSCETVTNNSYDSSASS